MSNVNTHNMPESRGMAPQPVPAKNNLLAKSDYITLDQMEKEDSTSYYTIQSNVSKFTTAILFEIPVSNGTRILVDIPATWIPIDLSVYLDKKTACASAEFRKIISSGKLHLVKAATAKAILETSSAKQEAAANEKRKMNNTESYMDLLKTQQELLTQGERNASPTLNAGKNGISFDISENSIDYEPSVRSIVRDCIAYSPEKRVRTVMSLSSSLNSDECSFLIANLEDETALEAVYSRLGEISA